MDTNKFRTNHEVVLTNKEPAGNNFIIGLDIGYGGTKVFLENGYICFPSYVKLIDDEIALPDKKDILYRDNKTNEIYIVGYNAQNMIGQSDTNDAELFSRKRYLDSRYRAIINTALGIATARKINEKDGRKIIVQSSLPASYLKGDAKQFQSAVMNNLPFSLKLGNNKWIDFQFDFTPGNVPGPIPQPMGVLYSVITDKNGHMVQSNDPKKPDAKRLLTGGTLVIDAGFETLDIYGIQARRKMVDGSIDDLGMRAVLDMARGLILEDTGEDIQIQEIQKYLTTGTFTVLNEETMSSEKVSIESYIKKANETIIERAKKKLQSATDSFRGYENIIIGGGTGAAWYDSLSEWLSKMQVCIYRSDMNDNLGMHLSVARGDYMYYRALELSKKQSQA